MLLLLVMFSVIPEFKALNYFIYIILLLDYFLFCI
jgi:hypothetical protein